ncbi:MAG: hypothetical protein FWC79_07595 [Oscillospiraceae bacterium]|nr:hypothetical protein [Oscillospiraceae bacterium]
MGEKKVVCVHINEKIKVSDKKIGKVAKKLVRTLTHNNVSAIVLSECLKEIEILVNKLHEANINILDGRLLFNYLIYDVIQYVAKRQKTPIETLEISVLTDENDDLGIENMVLLAQNAKGLNIITNNIQKFKKLEAYLYEEKGILIKLSNNKRKALLRSDIIINTGFEEEGINKYTLPDKCVVINTNSAISIKSKRFNGININNYRIKIPSEYELDKFNDNIIYEAKIVEEAFESGIGKSLGKEMLKDLQGNSKFDNIREIMKRDEIEVISLIGSYGVVDEQEYYLTKTK